MHNGGLDVNGICQNSLHRRVFHDNGWRLNNPQFLRTRDCAYLSALQHERGEKVDQDLEDVSASIRPVEKDHVHGDLTLQSASALLSISCNGANQGSKSETNLQPGTATEDRMAFEEQNADKSRLEVSGANKANQAPHDDGNIMKNNTAHGGRTAQTARVSQNCNVTLHDKSSEANCFSEQKNEKNGTDVQKDNCCTSIPSSSKDRDRESAKKTSNEEKSEDTFPEISVRSKDQDIDDSLEGLSQQDLCIKCGEDGQLLKCSDCSLGAHDSCFGSSVTFEETNLFYCLVCFHKRANCFSEQKNEKNGPDVQKDNCRTSIPSSSKDRDGESAKKTSNEEKSEDTSPEICVRSKDQDIDDTLEGLSQQYLCIKCGKDGQLLECSGCSLAAHDSCFGSSVAFEGTDLFYCPQCCYQKATEACEKAKKTYCEARKNAAAFLGTAHVSKQHDEQLNGVQPGAANRDDIAKQDQHMPTSPRKRSSVHPQKRYSNPDAPTRRRKKTLLDKRRRSCFEGSDGKKSLHRMMRQFHGFGYENMAIMCFTRRACQKI